MTHININVQPPPHQTYCIHCNFVKCMKVTKAIGRLPGSSMIGSSPSLFITYQVITVSTQIIKEDDTNPLCHDVICRESSSCIVGLVARHSIVWVCLSIQFQVSHKSNPSPHSPQALKSKYYLYQF